VKALLPIVTRLRERFGIGRMCVVADRGMISAETIAELERRGIDYILGARERSDAEVRKIVLADRKPMVPLIIPRARGGETAIEIKEVVVGDWGPRCKPRRYVVCFNPEQAQRDAAARAAILDSLQMKLRQGDKGLVGNAGYRRFLATPREGHFEIDADRIAEDTRFDGLYVLRTNSKMSTLSVALAYRQLWRVEAIFKTAKSNRSVAALCDTQDKFAPQQYAIASPSRRLASALGRRSTNRVADAGRPPIVLVSILAYGADTSGGAFRS